MHTTTIGGKNWPPRLAWPRLRVENDMLAFDAIVAQQNASANHTGLLGEHQAPGIDMG